MEPTNEELRADIDHLRSMLSFHGALKEDAQKEVIKLKHLVTKIAHYARHMALDIIREEAPWALDGGPRVADYAAGAPPWYYCSECGAKRVRLWREYQTMASRTVLECRACAMKSQDYTEEKLQDIPTRDDAAIGWRVAAIPCEDDETYWGYTSVPPEGLVWWKRLPVKE